MRYLGCVVETSLGLCAMPINCIPYDLKILTRHVLKFIDKNEV